MSELRPKAPHAALTSLLFFLGLAALAWTVHKVGAGEILGAFKDIDRWDYAVFLFYPLVSIWDAWGWQYVFAKPWNKIPIFHLFLVRLAGEGINNVTPLFDLGGEPLKASLLHRALGVPKHAAVSATIGAKSFLFFSEVLFWFCGLAPALFMAPVDGKWKWALSVFCIGSVAFSFFLISAQRIGFFSKALKWLSRRAPGARWLDNLKAPVESVDEALRDIYKSGGAPIAAFGLHFIGWLAGGIETYLMFHVLGLPLGMLESIAIEALFQLTRTASFMIPFSLGAQEAGMAIYAGWFGGPGSIGVAVSLLKRARQMLWNGAGFAAWGYYEWVKPAAKKS